MEFRTSDPEYDNWGIIGIELDGRIHPRCLDCDVPLSLDAQTCSSYVATCRVCGMVYEVSKSSGFDAGRITVDMKGIPDPCVECHWRSLTDISQGFDRGNCKKNYCFFHGFSCEISVKRCGKDKDNFPLKIDLTWPYRSDLS